MLPLILKLLYSEKATKVCKISTLLLTECTVVKSKVKISQKFVAFSEYVNFKKFAEIRLPWFLMKYEKLLWYVRNVEFRPLSYLIFQ